MDGRITAPAPGQTALLIVDMINDLDFDDAEAIRQPALAAAEAILALRDAADAADVPVIYVNDNGDRWHSDRSALVARVQDHGGPGADIARRLTPRDADYFVIKPQFSGFYATNLPVLLPRLEASRLILTGIAADICVLFTAADAHMREYGLWVPADTVASFDQQRTRWALDIMAGTMGADVRATTDLSLEDWLQAI
ncbi:isochorismatase family cysteine hydrolase [Sphingomonas sp. KR1UV-12]|uniref:Isochorismatase family cysteine hydrolase n=1 Tax=Sphingomonas aurea TaxID=3063994 RepID=A0ABT9EL26_9SPHN|nr:isochorismatase family cysteine hydrolase [Sphingomonas sp. KR1UV-12]MDP1027672.1 isochorismatase family cysteine hydrolase [Sphingomonas sp. KR1UV-12]